MSFETLTETIAAAPDLVVVDCSATWCGPCRLMTPVMREVADEADGVTVLEVDVDDEPVFAMHHGVMSVPTLLFFQDGRLVHRLVGARPKRAVLAEIEARRAALA